MNELAPSPADRKDAELLRGSPDMEDNGVRLRDYWRVLRKRLWLIGLCCFGTVFITALVILTMTRIYTAETTLLIDRNAPHVLDIREAVSEPSESQEYDFYRTQYEILKSPTLAAWVIQELSLETNPLVTGEGREEGFISRLWAQALGWVAEQGWARRLFPPPPKIDTEEPFGIKPGLIGSYMGMLEVRPVPRTQLVTIAFNTPDPELSARMANAHAQAYIRQGLEIRTRANEEAEHFLEEKLVELKGRVEKSEAALNRYRRDREIISLNDKENIVVERLADLNKRLTEAEAERIALEAQIHGIHRRNYEFFPAVMNSLVVQTLKEQLVQREAESTRLSSLYKPGHPRLDEVKAQVEEARRQLRQEIQREVSGIQLAYLAAVSRERALRDRMEEQKAVTLGLKDASVEYAILAREVDTNRELYNSVLQRMKETGVAAELRASNVSIINKAIPPRTPSKPQKKKTFLLSALMGLMAGAGLALFFEHLDNTLKTPEEVERYLRLPNLGVVPDFSNIHRYNYARQPLPHSAPQIGGIPASGNKPVPFHHPFSVVTDAYSTIRTAILLSRAEEPPKTILFTSAMHGEGKTATVINMATAFAKMEVKVLLIDADLRRPRCHTALRMDNGLGLTELLTGHVDPQEVIRPPSIDHFFFLSSGSSPPNPTELVGSKKMRQTLASLQEHYDYVLIDSPPVISVSDAVLLSTMVDGVVLVVDSQETPKHVVRKVHSRLSYARAKILGVMLNRVNLRSGDYAYDYQPYYSSYRHAGL